MNHALACLLTIAALGQPGAAPKETNAPLSLYAATHGINRARMPMSPAIKAHGPDAMAFVQRALYGPDADVPNDRADAYLLLAGPKSEAAKAKDLLPQAIADRTSVYLPGTFEPTSYFTESGLNPNALRAVVLSGGRHREYEGLWDRPKVIAALNAVLGLQVPTPSGPNKPGPSPPKEMPLVAVVLSFLAGSTLGPIACVAVWWFGLRPLGQWLRKRLEQLVHDLVRNGPGPPSNAGPTAPN